MLRADGQGEPGDGVWTDERGKPLLVFTADCLPVAIARGDGGQPAIAAVHVGWRGLLAGIAANAAAALGGGKLAAVVGPGIGPCCYEVGEEVAEPFRARFGGGILRDGKLDLWSATERALRDAGAEVTGSTSAPPATRSSSSPTVASTAPPAARD